MFSLSYSHLVSKASSANGMENFTLTVNNTVFTPQDHLILGCYLIVVGILSVVGNAMLLILMFRFPPLRTPNSLVLASLAFVDLGMAILGFPFAASSNFANRWLFGYLGCQWYGFNGMLFGYGSIGMLTVVSIDRYICLVRRDKDPGELYRFNTVLITCVWVNAIIWALAPIVGWGRYDLEPSGAACTIAWWNNDVSYVSYVIAVFLVNFLFPIGIMTYCYVRVISFVRLVGDGGRQENLEWTNEKEIVKMSVACVIAFILVWSPYAVICLWAIFTDPSNIPPKLSVTPALFAKTSAFFNPFIYAITNRRIRLALCALIRGKKTIEGLDSVALSPVTAQYT